MLVAPEEHDGAGVVEFVHLVEVGHLVDVADVDDGEVAYLFRDLEEDLWPWQKRGALLVCNILFPSGLEVTGKRYKKITKWRGEEQTYLVHSHAVRVGIAAEADDDESFVFAEDGLVDVPAALEMRETD